MTITEDLEAGSARKRRPKLFRNASLIVGAVIVLLVVLPTLAAPLLTHQNPILEQPSQALQGPSLHHPFGTDEGGRDIMARVLYGGRYSLAAGVIAVALGTAGGTVIGLTAGFFGGRVDFVFMRLIDLLMAFPGNLLALTVAAILGAGLNNAILAIGIATVPGVARVVEAATLQTRANLFVESSEALGARPARVMGRHVLPNVFSQVIVLLSTGLGNAVLSVAALGFLGLGLQPPTPEWGAILNDGQEYVTLAWWISVFPGLFITVFVMGVNILGDGVRDILDPRLSGK